MEKDNRIYKIRELLSLPIKRRGMFGSIHQLECHFLSIFYAHECLKAGSLCFSKVDSLWHQARRSIHGENYGPLVLADLPATDPMLVTLDLIDAKNGAQCVRDSFRSVWICVRSRAIDRGIILDGEGSETTILLSGLVERFLDSPSHLLAPDQEESLLWSLLNVWEVFTLPVNVVRNLHECVYKQITSIGGTSTGIAWRCSDIHGCSRRRRYTSEESVIADQQVINWVNDYIQVNDLNQL